MFTQNSENSLSAFDSVWESKENSESGVNPERYRHCERGGPARDESRSLEKSEKAVWVPKKRESGDLLKRCLFIDPCKYGVSVVFCAENRLRRSLGRRSFFVFSQHKDNLHFSGREAMTCYDA